MSSDPSVALASAPPSQSEPVAAVNRNASRRWLLLGGLAFVLAAIWPAYRRIEAFVLLDRASQQMAQDDFQAAAKTYEQLASRQPHSADVQLRWAIACRRQAAYSEVEQHLEEAKRLGASDESLQEQRNMLRFQLRGDPAAEKYLQRLLQTDMDEDLGQQVIEALAIGCLNNQRPREALRHLTEWTRWRPVDLRPYFLRGKAYIELSSYAEAADDFRKMVAARPNYLAAQSHLADVLFAEYKYEEAHRAYSAAERIQPTLMLAVMGRGRCANELGRTEEARECLERALTLNPTPPQKAVALTELARIYVDARQDEKARKNLEEALALREGDVTAHTLLASVMSRLGDKAQATAHRDRAQELTRVFTEISRLKDSAIADPKNPDLLFRIGQQLLVCNRVSEATPWLQAAAREAPNSAPIHSALADCFERQQQPELARRHQELAAALKPPVPETQP